MNLQLLTYPHEALTWVCKPVVDFDEQLSSELTEMQRIMLDSGGCGLAANQVGLNKRMFVMLSTDGRLYSLVNPVIVDHGLVVNKLYREGCLSSKNVFDYVPRYEWVQVNYQDKLGQQQSLYAASSRDSTCVQHEIDHLHGLFWWDRLPKNAAKRLMRKWEKRNE